MCCSLCLMTSLHSFGIELTILIKYTLFDGLTYNTRGYFASCVIRAMSKMSARIIF